MIKKTTPRTVFSLYVTCMWYAVLVVTFTKALKVDRLHAPCSYAQCCFFILVFVHVVEWKSQINQSLGKYEMKIKRLFLAIWTRVCDCFSLGLSLSSSNFQAKEAQDPPRSFKLAASLLLLPLVCCCMNNNTWTFLPYLVQAQADLIHSDCVADENGIESSIIY